MPFWDIVGSLAGDVMGAISSSRSSSMDRQQRAREFAHQVDMQKNQVLYRVQDAQRAGVHPLFAMGMQPQGFSPSMPIGDSTGPYLQSMGQNIGRAVGAYMTREERDIAAFDAYMQRERAATQFAQETERNDLENTLLRSQIAQLNAPGTAPGFPDGTVHAQPARPVVPAGPHAPGREAGVVQDYGYSRTADGGLTIVPSYDMQERAEEFPQSWLWGFRNQVLPAFTGHRTPSLREHPLPAGQTWRWNVWRQSFQPYDLRSNEFIIDGRRYPNNFHGDRPVVVPRR